MATYIGGGGGDARIDIGAVSVGDVEIKNDNGNPIPTIQGLEIPAHDYIGLTYTGDNLTGVVYKDGGSGGTTVATLTLAYSGSQLTSVTKS
jgi:hypothetical protein